MRRGIGSLVVVLAAMAVPAPGAPGQDPDTRYWPLREINFPVPVEKVQAMSPRPAKLRFWVAENRGRFKQVAERAPGDLDVIDRDKSRRGFRYESPADGEYEFALQFVYPDGEATPREADLTAQYRVVFDTRPPAVRASLAGTSGVEWDVQDDNLKPDAIEVQVRWAGQRGFTAVSPRAFAARDRYTWAGLKPDQPLEVRVLARDRAGHEGTSRVFTLPAASAGPGLGGDGGARAPDPVTRAGGDRIGTGFGNPDDFAARSQARVDYVNTKDLVIESKLTRVTRSGVQSAELWVRDAKSEWRLAKTEPHRILPTDPNPVIKIAYRVDKDGLYGFRVIPINGAGGKEDPPRRDDPAQMLIHVDTEPPVVKVKAVRVAPGGTVGPRVEIEWEVTESNLMDRPVMIEYSDQKAGGKWQRVVETPIANTGRYVWEVEDKELWRFYVRVSAVDWASNRGEAVYDQEIKIDLEKPQAVIEKVQGGSGSGNPPPRKADRVPADPPALPPSGPAAPALPASNPSGPPPVPVLPGGGDK